MKHPLSTGWGTKCDDFEKPVKLREGLTISTYYDDNEPVQIPIRITLLAPFSLRLCFPIEVEHPEHVKAKLTSADVVSAGGMKDFKRLDKDIEQLRDSLPEPRDLQSPLLLKHLDRCHKSFKMNIYVLTMTGMVRIMDSKDWNYAQLRVGRCISLLGEMKVWVVLGDGKLTDEGYLWGLEKP